MRCTRRYRKGFSYFGFRNFDFGFFIPVSLRQQRTRWKTNTLTMRKKKVSWQPNDVFVIPLLNGSYAVGHILDQRLINAVRIALYSEVINGLGDIDFTSLIDSKNLISLIEVTREQLDYGVWKIIGNKRAVIPVDRYPNEQFRANKWINSIVRDAAIAEDFLNAFHGFLPWNKYFDPQYFDKLLVNISKKPSNLVYKK